MISTTATYQLASFTPGNPPGSFSFAFSFEQTSEIYAVLYGTALPGVTLVQGVDFTLATVPPAASGTINVIGPNWAGAYAAYGNIRIYRKTAIVNSTSFVNGGAIDANVLEFVIDEITQIMQENGPGGNSAVFNLQAPVTDPPGLNYLLPVASVRANTGLIFDANGNVVAGSPSPISINAAWQAALLQGTVAGLLSGIGALIVVNTSVSNTPAALNGNYFYIVGAGGATAQNFTAGATTAGMTLGVYNSGAGACAVNLGGSVTVSLIQGQYLGVTWNGTTWEIVANLLPGGIAAQPTRKSITTSGSLGTLSAVVDTSYYLSAASTATLPAAPDHAGLRFTFKAKTTATSTISANAGQTIGTTSSTSFVLYAQEDYVTLEWDGTSVWYVVATNGPAQASLQNSTLTCNNSSTWTALGIGLTLGTLAPGVYDIDMDVSAYVAATSVLAMSIGNSTTPISSEVGVTSNPTIQVLPFHVGVKGYVLSASATIQGIYYSSSGSNTITYAAAYVVGRISARRIG